MEGLFVSGWVRRWRGYHEGVGESGGGWVIMREWVSREVVGSS